MRLLLFLFACVTGDVCKLPPTPLVTPRPAARTRNIILVTIDGVRWQEIFGGAKQLSCGETAQLVPNLHALGEAGISLGAEGEPILSSGPKFVSLPGYREIVRGRASADCTDNECARLAEPTLLDEVDGEVAVIASWERIARVTPRDALVSAGRHGGNHRDRLRVNSRASRILDEGAVSRARPGYADYRPDRYTAELAREVLRERRPRFLWVSLGDTDEYAHRGDYPGYLTSLRAADRLIGELWQSLGEMGQYGAETTIVVTADHGRADDFRDHGDQPESSRVWLIAAGGAVVPRGPVASERPLHLADIAPSLRALLSLPPEGRPIEPLLPPAWVANLP